MHYEKKINFNNANCHLNLNKVHLDYRILDSKFRINAIMNFKNPLCIVARHSCGVTFSWVINYR